MSSALVEGHTATKALLQLPIHGIYYFFPLLPSLPPLLLSEKDMLSQSRSCLLVMLWCDVVQVVNSTIGDIADDPTGVQSNSPIAAPPEVEVVDETKYEIIKLFTW